MQDLLISSFTFDNLIKKSKFLSLPPPARIFEDRLWRGSMHLLSFQRRRGAGILEVLEITGSPLLQE
jgi:hypothetical protein